MLNKLMIDMRKAMKEKEKKRVQAIRNIVSLVKSKQIDSGKNLSDKEIILIIQSHAKKLKDSIEQYKKGNREDLARDEKVELNYTESYLPEQLNESELRVIVTELINSMGAKSLKDMKDIMPKLMQQISGKGDGKMASNIVREILSR